MQLLNSVDHVQADTEAMAQTVIKAFENLEPGNLEPLRQIYTQDICFEDPAHGIQGLPQLVGYFESLYKNLNRCQFKFHKTVAADGEIFFSWTMMVEHKKIRRGEVIRVEGASYLKTRGDKVFYHRDYFDLGAMVYENIPVLGAVIRLIRYKLGQ